MVLAAMGRGGRVDHDSTRRTFGKRVLVEISHAIERFALAAPREEPLIVIALFQKLSYFEREAAVYRDIADRGALTIVGLTEDFPPHLPPGVSHALFGSSDPLSREWSVTVLGATGGATLIATDLETVDPDAATLEQGRLFDGRWSFRRDDAYREIVRLRSALNVPRHLVERIDERLRQVVADGEPDDQGWREAPLRFFADRVDGLLRDFAAAREALITARDDTHERDPRSGLPNQHYLARWTAGLGAGTLPVGLAVLRVAGVTGIRGTYGLRAELAAFQSLAGCLLNGLTGADRAIRLGGEDFLVVAPGRTADEMADYCDRVAVDIARLDQSYPFVPLPTVAAATGTRSRPLPIDRLRARLDGATARSAVLVG
jgi:GGDEF domain-containing protein/DICT domain-containing protein